MKVQYFACGAHGVGVSDLFDRIEEEEAARYDFCYAVSDGVARMYEANRGHGPCYWHQTTCQPEGMAFQPPHSWQPFDRLPGLKVMYSRFPHKKT